MLMAVGMGLGFSVTFAADAPSAKIIFIDGTVQAKNTPQAAWTDAKIGDELATGAEVMTGVNSNCELALADDRKSAIRLKPETHAKLASLDPVKVDLQSGRVFSLVRDLKKGSKFEVGTLTAIASARGTGWEQDMDSVGVLEDSVHVENTQGQEMEIQEGQGIEIEDDGSFGDSFEVPAESRSEFEEFEQAAPEHLASAPAEGSSSSEPSADAGATAETTGSADKTPEAPPDAAGQGGAESSGEGHAPEEPNQESTDTLDTSEASSESSGESADGQDIEEGADTAESEALQSENVIEAQQEADDADTEEESSSSTSDPCINGYNSHGPC